MSGEIIKADRDFTKEVDAALPDAEKEAQNGQVQAAVEKLLALEKQTRQSSDLASTSRVIVAIVTMCKNSGDWSLLNEQVQVLSKKHGQLKQAITKMVQVVMGFLDDAPNLDVKLSVIETLRTVTEGKVRVQKCTTKLRSKADNGIDLRRGGARESYPHPFEHQARARRHHRCNRHFV
jgi:26S proteasome regulatory subunit N5